MNMILIQKHDTYGMSDSLVFFPKISNVSAFHKSSLKFMKDRGIIIKLSVEPFHKGKTWNFKKKVIENRLDEDL